MNLIIPHRELDSFHYAVALRTYRSPSFAFAELPKAHEPDRMHYRAIATASDANLPHDVTGYTEDQLINDFLNRYARFCHARRIA